MTFRKKDEALPGAGGGGGGVGGRHAAASVLGGPYTCNPLAYTVPSRTSSYDALISDFSMMLSFFFAF